MRKPDGQKLIRAKELNCALSPEDNCGEQRRVKVVLGNLPFLGPAQAKLVYVPTPVSGAGMPGPLTPKKEYFLRSTLTRLESRALGDDFR